VRNAYLLINYGDYVDGTTTKIPPYVQLLSITDPTAAHLDFVSTRLGGTDTTGMQRFDDTTPVSNTDNVANTFDQQQRLIVIIGVVAGSVFLLAALVGLYLTVRRRRNRHLHFGPDLSTVDMGLYHPLHRAAPQGEMHPVQGYQTVPTSTTDLHTEATRTLVAAVDKVDHSVLRPAYEESDPRDARGERAVVHIVDS
jgi:hypothetical protein